MILRNVVDVPASSAIRELLESAVDWAYSYDDHMGLEDFNQRDHDVALAKGILRKWREEEEEDA